MIDPLSYGAFGTSSICCYWYPEGFGTYLQYAVWLLLSIFTEGVFPTWIAMGYRILDPLYSYAGVFYSLSCELVSWFSQLVIRVV